MILDGHIHIKDSQIDSDFGKKISKANVEGGILLSLCPDSFKYMSSSKNLTAQERVENVLEWCKINPGFSPFFWVDPLEKDALEQVQMAKEKGIKGFKVISNNYYPYEDRPMEVFTEIAKNDLPILFHSGISYGGTDSSKYNKPVGFELLLEIPNIRFSLAHVSWPWHDELLALYGKFQNMKKKRKNFSGEMFIDITPGTPPIYREEVLTKLFTIGYDVKNNVFFGTDNKANNYDFDYTNSWTKRDDKIYKKINLDDKIIDNVYSKNLKRFING